MNSLNEARSKTVGLKQTLKAVENGTAQMVYIAEDAEDRIKAMVLQACRDKGIETKETKKMTELGKACGIQVRAAVAAVLK